MTKQQRQAHVKRLWGTRSPKDISEELGISLRTIQRDRVELDLPLFNEPTVHDHVKGLRKEQDLRRQKKTAKELAKRVIELEAEIEAAINLKESRNYYKIPAARSKGSEAVAVAVASDWHVEEVVHEWQVNGLNKFNEPICQDRVRRFFQHTAKLVNTHKESIHIDTLVLALLGDFISGSIHDELMEGNRLLPSFAIIEVQEHLLAGINYLLEHTDVKLVIPCSSGNHGRMTKKNRISTEAGNSLERYMYHCLQTHFKENKRVEFIITDGYHIYVDLFDNYTIRFHHGHAIRYGGGVGGISIPINKAVAQWNKLRTADLDVVGHFHQFLDGGNWIVNGSLVGYSAYALSIKASYEPPRQAFFLIDKEAGKTVVQPIILNQDR